MFILKSLLCSAFEVNKIFGMCV